MNDKEAFIAPFEAVDPNLGHMLRAYLEEASLPIVKLRLRAAVAKVTRTNSDQMLRDDIAEILNDIAENGMPMPRDLDVALDAILCNMGIQP